MSLQTTLAFLLALALIEAVPPPGYKKKPEPPDENPPKYEYEYAIHGKGTGQGKSEARDGIFASGRYYVQGKNSSQNVEYVADDWGYHPYVEYSNQGPHSKFVTQIALDAEAVKALRSKGTKIPEAINVGAAVQNQILQPISAGQAQQGGFSSSTQDNSIQQSSAQVSVVQHQGNSLQQEPLQAHHHSYSIQHGASKSSSPAQGHQQSNLNNIHSDASQQSSVQTPVVQQQQQQQSQSHHHSYSIQHGASSKNPSQAPELQGAQQEQLQSNQVQQAGNAFYLQQQQQQVDTNQQVVENSVAQQPANTVYLHQEHQQLDLNQKTVENSVAQQQPTNNFYAHQDQQQQILILGQSPNQILQPQPLVAPNSENPAQGGFNLEQQAQILTNGGVVFLQNLHHGAFQQIAPSAYEAPQLQFIVQEQNQHQETTTNAQRFETAALYESSGQNSLGTTPRYDESLLNLEHLGGYGSKINVKVTHNAGGPPAPPEHLVHDFRDLVSGQDVLNINQAINNQNYEGSKLEGSTAATAIMSEYGPPAESVASSTETSAAAVTSAESVHTLSEEPIVVADLNAQSYSENSVLQSSTQSFLEQEEPPKRPTSSEITITPRPVSTKFLAPITAGIQLQSSEEASKSDNFIVDVQKSIPYYLGKIEYYHQPGGESSETKEINITASATQNIQLGGFLQHPVRERPKTMELKSQAFSQSLTSPGSSDQIPEQEQQVLVVDKPPVEVEVERPTLTQIIEKTLQVPVEVTRYVDRPYPVPVAVPKPYPVEVEKIVEKVVRQPYPVEVRVPVQVTVEKRIPVPQYIDREVPVEKIVEKAVPQYIPKPYPVAVRVPVPVPQAFYIPVEVPKPYPVQVTKYVNKPYAVPRPYPVQVTQTIEVPIPQPVPVEVRVPHPVPVEVPKFINRVVDRPYPVFLQYQQLQQQQHNLRQMKPPANNHYEEPLVNSASFQSNVRVMPCVDLRLLGIKKPYCNTIHNNNYIGLVPPKLPFNNNNNNYHNLTNTAIQKQRKTRQNFDNNNVRLEYGFMPPLIPSLEIDEQGNPVEKHT